MDLFGRKQRKQRIEDLEAQLQQCKEEKQDLERQRDKHKKRFQEAETAKQQAQRELNKAETKIETLQDRLETTDEQTDKTTTQPVSLDEMTHLLETLASMSFPGTDAVTRARTIEDRGEVTLVDPHLIGLRFKTPLPLDPFERRQGTFVLEPLEEQLAARYLVMHVSAGGSGAAIIDDQQLQDHTIVTSDIKANHKKGGYSQKRFENIREQQIDEHIETFIDTTTAIREHGVDQVIITGAPQLRKRISTEITTDAIERGTPVGAIEDTDDLMAAFSGAMQFEHERLDPETIQRILRTD